MILYKKLLDIDRKGTMSKAMTPVYKLKKKNKQIYICTEWNQNIGSRKFIYA